MLFIVVPFPVRSVTGHSLRAISLISSLLLWEVPTPRTWLPRSQEIVAILRATDADELDRAAIERLFEIQRRAALNLMDQVGTTKQGQRHAVSRTSLLSWVERIVASEGGEFERRQRVNEQIAAEMAERHARRQALVDAGKTPVSFTLPQELLSSTITSLPHEIEISAGRIVVSFDPDRPEEALQLLYSLGLALSNDFESFLAIQHGSLHANRRAS